MDTNEEFKMLGIAINDPVAWTEYKKGKRKLHAGTLRRIEGCMGVVQSGRSGKREIKVPIGNLRPFKKERG